MAAPQRPAPASPDPPPFAAEPAVVELVLDGPLAPGDIPALVARVQAQARGVAESVVACDVERVGPPDIGTVDALARLALAVQRGGGRVRLDHASPELCDLVVLSGLARVLRCAALPLEPLGKTEQREEPGGIEKERHARDSTV